MGRMRRIADDATDTVATVRWQDLGHDVVHVLTLRSIVCKPRIVWLFHRCWKWVFDYRALHFIERGDDVSRAGIAAGGGMRRDR